MQSSDYRLARNVNCPVAVIDFYSNPIREDIDYANMFCQEGELKFDQLAHFTCRTLTAVYVCVCMCSHLHWL